MKKEETTALCKRSDEQLAENITPVTALAKPEEPVAEKTAEPAAEKKTEKKKSRSIKWPVIICAAAVLVLIGAVLLGTQLCSPERGGLAGIFGGADPEEILGKYIDALEAGDAQAIADLHHPKVLENGGSVETDDILYSSCSENAAEEYTVTAEWDAGDYYGGSTSWFIEYYKDNMGIEVTDMTVLAAEISIAGENLQEDYLEINKDGEVCAGFLFCKVDGKWYIDTITDFDE